MSLSAVQRRVHGALLGFFSGLAHASIHHPKVVLLVAVLITLAAVPGLGRLRLRTDGHALIAPDAAEVRVDQEIRDTFGLEDQVVVLIHTEQPGGIYNSDTLQLVRDLTTGLARLAGINPANLLSLATEPGLHYRPGTLVRQTLLEPPLKTPAELERLREDLRRIELYTGTLVSADGRSTAILLGAPPGTDRTQLYERVLGVIAARGPTEEDISVTGAPVAEALLGIHILEDLGVPRALLGTSTRSHTEQVAWSWPGSLHDLRVLLARRLGLVPLALLVMMLVFYASFRSLPATLLPLPEVGATLVFVFGLMGYCQVPIYLTIAVMPVLLTAMCVTDEIHVFSRYFALLRERPTAPQVELVRQTVEELVCPVVSTTLTTAVGFVSFAFSPLKPVQAFGIFTALGVLFSLLYSLSVIPAMLTLINARRLVPHRPQPRRGSSGVLAAWLGKLALAVVRRRGWAVAAVAVALLVTPLGLRRLVIQDSWIDGFDPQSEFRRATEMVNRQFFGMHLLLVCLESSEVLKGELPAGPDGTGQLLLPGNLVKDPAEISGSSITFTAATEPGRGNLTNAYPAPRVLQSHIEMVQPVGTNLAIRLPSSASNDAFWRTAGRPVGFQLVAHAQFKPEVIEAARRLAGFLRTRSQYAVGGVLGPHDYLTTTRFMVRPSDPHARELPPSASEARLLWDYYRVARGTQRLRQALDTNAWRTLTTVFMKDANFVDTARLLSELRAYEREQLAQRGLKVSLAGDVAVSQSLIRGIVATQMQSLAGSLVGICLVTALFGRSLRWGVFCVLPSALAVLLNFAVMGWTGIPLGVATSMFAGMTLGIGVDFAIHLLEGYELASAAGCGHLAALRRAMELTGPAVLINTVAISAGFGVLVLSQVPANARLGLLTVLGLVNCLVATLLLVPVLLQWWPPRRPQPDTATKGPGAEGK
jgi:predicted RND superfamily exporter protein